MLILIVFILQENHMVKCGLMILNLELGNMKATLKLENTFVPKHTYTGIITKEMILKEIEEALKRMTPEQKAQLMNAVMAKMTDQQKIEFLSQLMK